MKIVVIDSYTLNPGDLSWDDISALGEIKLYERTSESEVLSRCADADIVLTNKVPFDRETISQLPKLKLIAVTATGYNIIDVAAATERGIVVSNVPDYGTDSVAQHTFALILEIMNRVGAHAQSVVSGDWQNSKDFSYALTPLTELQGKTLGLVGFGNIGRKTAEIAGAFGMKIKYHTPSPKETSVATYSTLDDIFKESDIVSLHLPLKADNREFVNTRLLKLMKPSAVLINTSRGQLINEQDLAEALNFGVIAAAGLDVLSVEPPEADNPLLTAKNCLITPHNAWMSKEARGRIMEITKENLRAFVSGKPINVVE